MLLSYLFLKLNRENLCLFYFFIPSHLSSIFELYHYLLFVLFISFLSFCSLTVFSLNSPNFLFVSFSFLSLYLQHSQAIVLKADPWEDEDSQLFFLIRSLIISLACPFLPSLLPFQPCVPLSLYHLYCLLPALLFVSQLFFEVHLQSIVCSFTVGCSVWPPSPSEPAGSESPRRLLFQLPFLSDPACLFLQAPLGAGSPQSACSVGGQSSPSEFFFLPSVVWLDLWQCTGLLWAPAQLSFWPLVRECWSWYTFI